MREFIEAIILGIVQGLTEFLPVSSSGHLLFLQKLGVGEPSLFFNVALHIGTLLAVLVYYRKDIAQIVRKPFTPYNYKLILSTVLTVILALIAKKYFIDILEGKYLITGFILTAVLLYTAQLRLDKGKNIRSAGLQADEGSRCDGNGQLGISYPAAVFAGIMQGIAVFPGISRSGSTITALLLSGSDRKSAAKYSFLLSVPVIFGAFILEFPSGTLASESLLPLLAGMLAAFVSGIFAIGFFVKLLSDKSLIPFCIYLVILAAAMFAIKTFSY